MPPKEKPNLEQGTVGFNARGLKIHIHRNLVKSSPLLQKLVNCRTKESGEDGCIEIEFPQDDFRTYAQWLYGDAIQVDSEEWLEMASDSRLSKLYDLYGIGVRLQDVRFQDEIMDLIIKMAEDNDEPLDMAEVRIKVLGHEPELPKLRELIADCLVFGRAECNGTPRSAELAEDVKFASLIASAFLDKKQGLRWEEPSESRCRYHVHETDEGMDTCASPPRAKEASKKRKAVSCWS